MDILEYKKYEPLFGCWTITRLLQQNANQMLFEMENKRGAAAQKAILRTVFIPRRRSGAQDLMKQMGLETEPTEFVQKIAEDIQQELSIRESLKGQPHIVALKGQQIIKREDKSGFDVLMLLESLTPLSVYLQQHGLTEKSLLQLGIDICKAMESCRQAQIFHRNICEGVIFVTQDGAFKLGRFENAGRAAKKEDDIYYTADVKALGELLCRLAEKTGTVRSPEFAANIQRIWRTGIVAGDYDLAKIRGGMEQTAYRPEPAAEKAETVRRTVSPTAQAQNTVWTDAVPRKPVLSSHAVPAQVADQTPVQTRSPAAPAQAKTLPEEAAEWYTIQNEPKTTRLGDKTKWLAAVAGGLVCLAVLGFAGVRFGIPAIKGIRVSLISRNNEETPAATPEPDAGTGQEPAENATAAEPTLSPEEVEEVERTQRIQRVLSTMQNICTGTQPQVTDPATWNEAGRELMDRLEADPYYQEWKFTAIAAAFDAGSGDQGMRADMAAAIGQWQEGAAVSLAEQYPYLIAVNRAASTVTVYTTDEAGRYTVPYMAMVCSGGPDTPTGFWFTPIRYQWRTLVGPCYGQNATRIWNSYLFHSVPYYTQHKDDVEYDQYNQLGTQASLGCIRLAIVDVKWIFDNCPLGTPVVIYDDENDPGPMGKPGTIYIDPTNTEMRGWDPTDPDPANPWGDEYLPGTAIRSDAAWAEYNAAMEDGRWNNTINVTDLRGESTDSAVEGTRG